LRRKIYGSPTIVESFKPNSPTSVLSGIVMRHDFIIDDFVLGYTTLECDDTTDMLLKMYNDVGRTAITRHCS
jgi:endonuclease V-like protein UPF0215 family